MKICKEAPKPVINYYKKVGQHVCSDYEDEVNRKEVLRLLEKLLADSIKMNRVWKKVKRLETNLRTDASKTGMMFFRDVQRSIRISENEKLTPRQRQIEQESLIKDIRSIASKVDDYEIGIDLLQYFTKAELTGLQLLMRGIGISISDDDVLKALERLPPLPKYLFHPSFKSIPSLAELLSRVADNIGKDKPITTALLNKPGGRNSEIVYFARTMGKTHSTYNDEYWYIPGTIADVAGIVFNSDIDLESIKKAVGSVRKNE